MQTVQSKRVVRSNRTLSRRSALATVGTLSLGAAAGCLGSVPGLEGNNQDLVEPTDPGDDPDGTPEEFHYWLEDNGISVDELYHDGDENDLHLFYESTADEEIESNDEIIIVMDVYTQGLIENGSDIQNLFTEVDGGFEGQTEGWGIQTEWVEQYLSEEISREDLFQTIMQTREYDGEDPDDGVDEELDEDELPDDPPEDGNESSEESDADDGNESSEDAGGDESTEGTDAGGDEETDDESTDGDDSTAESNGNETDDD